MEGLKLCPICHNVLYPREDRMERRLLHACNRCSFQIPMSRNIFFLPNSKDLPSKARTSALPHSKGAKCVKCKSNSGVAFFRGVVRDKEAQRRPSMALFVVCCNGECGHKWREDIEHPFSVARNCNCKSVHNS